MFKGFIENWIVLDNIYSSFIKIEGGIDGSRVVTSPVTKISQVGEKYLIYTQTGSIYLLGNKASVEGRILNETQYASFVNMCNRIPDNFAENIQSRIDHYNIEKISDGWEFVDRDPYRIEEDFVIV